MARIIKSAKGEEGRARVAQRVEDAEQRASEVVREAGDDGYQQGRLDAADLVRRVEDLEGDLVDETDRRVQGAAQALVEETLRGEVASPEGFLNLVRHSLRAMRRGRHPSEARLRRACECTPSCTTPESAAGQATGAERILRSRYHWREPAWYVRCKS